MRAEWKQAALSLTAGRKVKPATLLITNENYQLLHQKKWIQGTYIADFSAAALKMINFHTIQGLSLLIRLIYPILI